MILTTLEELRLCFPGHAIDHIDPYIGYIDNAEHEFLIPALGEPLYRKLCEHYDRHRHKYSSVDDYNTGYYNRLLLLAQRCVAFDAIGRSLDFQAVSINNAGLNFSAADDYKSADRDAKNDAKSSGTREAHTAMNRLLYTLEQWVRQSDTAETEDLSELREITELWRSSRYYYLAAQMLISSARIMQEYIDIMESREKFIRLLPDLRFVQEEQIATAIGDDFLDYLVHYALHTDIPAGTRADSPTPPDQETAPKTILNRIVHKLRKIEVIFLEGRTTVLKIDKDRKIRARDEGVLLLGRLCDYIRQNQETLLAELGDDKDVFEQSPLYVKPVPVPPDTDHHRPHHCGCHTSDFTGDDMALHVTMPLL